MRTAKRIRTTALCHGCGSVALGITTSQAHLRHWGRERAKDFHLCDQCRADVVERPLGAVVADMTDGLDG